MKILALDSSGIVAGAAIIEDGIITAEYYTDYKKTHSQTLLPMVDAIVKMTETDLSTLDALAVAKGPGSFTGLRIGSATVKGLGLALEKPVIGISTLEGLAQNVACFEGIICPLMDARRNQVYTALYRSKCGVMKNILEDTASDICDIIKEVNALREPVIYLGDGVVPYAKQIKELTEVSYQIAQSNLCRQHASSVAILAEKYFSEGKYGTADEFAPEYLRLSQAERELNEKQ